MSIFHPPVLSFRISCSVFLPVVLIVAFFNVSCFLRLCSISTAGVWRELYMLLNQTTSTTRVSAQEPLCPSKKLTRCQILTFKTQHTYTWTKTTFIYSTDKKRKLFNQVCVECTKSTGYKINTDFHENLSPVLLVRSLFVTNDKRPCFPAACSY